MTHRPRFPLILNATLIGFGALMLGAKGASHIAEPPQTIVEGHTLTTTDTRIVTRKIEGKIITLPGGERVVHVPRLVVRTDTKIIRIPAHNLPVTSLQSAVLRAKPNTPVTLMVYQTVTVPSEPVTVTETLPPSTVTDTLTVTVSVPLTPTTSDQGGTTLDSLHRPIQRQRSRLVQDGPGDSHLPQGQRRDHLHRPHLPGPPPPGPRGRR